MQKDCSQCGAPLNDGCDIVAVVRTKFKAIPSRIAYAIHNPTEVYEMQHYSCSLGDLLPDNDENGPSFFNEGTELLD